MWRCKILPPLAKIYVIKMCNPIYFSAAKWNTYDVRIILLQGRPRQWQILKPTNLAVWLKWQSIKKAEYKVFLPFRIFSGGILNQNVIIAIMNPSRYPICMGQFLHFSHHNGLMHHVEKILLEYSHIVSSTNFGRSFVPCKNISEELR